MKFEGGKFQRDTSLVNFNSSPPISWRDMFLYFKKIQTLLVFTVVSLN